MKQPIRALIYCRVAHPDALALDLQKNSVYQYAESKGYNIEAVVTEERSGVTMEREGLNRIMDMARDGEIDAVVTMSISRLGRNITDLINYINTLQSVGVTVEFMKEGLMSPQLIDTITLLSRAELAFREG